MRPKCVNDIPAAHHRVDPLHPLLRTVSLRWAPAHHEATFFRVMPFLVGMPVEVNQDPGTRQHNLTVLLNLDFL
jgi:hypothetical protein